MLTCSIMLCADRVIRDAQSNAISVINILEEITPEGLPIFIQRFMIYAFLHRDPESDPSKVRCQILITIGTNRLVEHDLEIDFQGKKNNRTIVDIGGLVIPASGRLETSLSYDGSKLNSFGFEIREPRSTKVAKM